MTERYDWAKDYAAKIRKDLRQAIKDGHIPEGSKVGARKDVASLMTAVRAYVDTPDPAKYRDDETGQLTAQGIKLGQFLNTLMAPYMDKDDGRHSFVDINLDGRGFSPNL